MKAVEIHRYGGPEELKYEEAAGGLTAGQRVLNHGASGGAGSFAVQFAKWKGADFADSVQDVDMVFNTQGSEVYGPVTDKDLDQIAHLIDANRDEEDIAEFAMKLVNLDMGKEIKRIPVRDQQQAALIINQLCHQYDMKSDTRRHQLHVANGKYAAYYDVPEGVVKLETIHPGVTEEEVREFLMEFPPFF